MSISILIPWSNREEIIYTLQSNISKFLELNAEVIIINCGGDNQWLTKNLKLIDYPLKHILVDAKIFNKSLALNIGALSSSTDYLFIMDADIILDHNFKLHHIHHFLEKNVVTVKDVVESQASKFKNEKSLVKELAHFTEIIFSDSSRVLVETSRINYHDFSKAGPGLIILKKKYFIEVGGLNSSLKFWGWEDIDLLFRLKFKLNLNRHTYGKVTHLSHDDSKRNLENLTRSESESLNYRACLLNYMQNNFNGSLSEDIKFLSSNK